MNPIAHLEENIEVILRGKPHAGPDTPYCPCGHHWLMHALGSRSGRPGYGRCFAISPSRCECKGIERS